MSEKDPLTTEGYWDATYAKRRALYPIDPTSSGSEYLHKLLDLKEKYGLEGKRVLEIGGGASAWLAYLSKRFPTSDFTCLDYSKVGIETLKTYANENDLNNISVIEGDMFATSEYENSFDLVYSHGVVEHFPDLPGALHAHEKHLSDQGIQIIIIPNMAGILGKLTKIMDRPVYDIHVPHDHGSLISGYEGLQMDILESGYLCSTNFGVLSSCVKRRYGLNWWIYAVLLTFSRAIWKFEEKVTALPTSRFFSPYIYVVSRKRPEA